MSLQIQLQKCKNVYCNNEVHPGIKKEYKKFCRACLNNKTGILSWPCGNPECDGIVTSHLLYKKYCSRKCKDQMDKPNRRKRAKLRYALKFQNKNCISCGGMIQKRHRQRYCSPYCKFLNDCKNHNLRLHNKIMRLI